MTELLYQIMPALKEIHQKIGLAVMDNSSFDALGAVHLVREDFLREHEKSGILPKVYADERRLCMVEHAITYPESIENPEVEWLGLDFNFPAGPAYKVAVFEMIKERLERFGSYVPDERNRNYKRIRVEYNTNPRSFEDYLLEGLDETAGRAVFLKVFDLQKNAPVKGPIVLDE